MAARTNTAGTKTTKTAEKAEKTIVPDVKPETPAPAAEPQKQVVPKEIDIHQYIPVRNGFQGVLVYISKRTGEQFLWEHFGDEQEIELQELKNAKSASKAFFENNWFMFDEEYRWVIDYLGVGAFYRNVLKPEEFDNVFTMTPDQIRETVAGLSKGQKASMEYRARQLIAEGGIDSNKAIAALEESLGVQLVER